MAPPIRQPAPLPLPVQYENPYLEEVRKGLRAGTAGLAAQAYGGGQALADYFGLEELEARAARGYERNIREAARFQPAVESIYDIQTPEQGLRWAAYRGAQILPSAASMVAGGGTGALVAGALRLPVAVGAATGAFTTSAVPQAGGIYREILDEGGVRAPGPALVGGAVGGGFELLPLVRGLRAATGAGPRIPTGRLIAGSIAGEAATEAAQEGTAIATRAYADPAFTPTPEEVGRRVGESAAVGALGGTMFGGTTAGVRAFRERIENERASLPAIAADRPARSTIFDDLSDADRQQLATMFPEFGPVNVDTGTEYDTDMEYDLGAETPLGEGLTFQDVIAMEPGPRDDRIFKSRKLRNTSRLLAGAPVFPDTWGEQIARLNEQDREALIREPGFTAFSPQEQARRANPYRRTTLREQVEHEARLAYPDDPVARREYVINAARNEYIEATGANSIDRMRQLEAHRADVENRMALIRSPEGGEQLQIEVSRDLDPEQLSEMHQWLTNQIETTQNQISARGNVDYSKLWKEEYPESFLGHFEVIAGPATPPQEDYSLTGRLGEVEDVPGKPRRDIVKQVTLKDVPSKKQKKYNPTEFEWLVPGTDLVINFPNLLTEMRQQYARFNKDVTPRSPRDEMISQLGIAMDLIAQEYPQISPQKWRQIPANQLLEDTSVNPNLRWGDVVPDRSAAERAAQYGALTTSLLRERPEYTPITQVEARGRFDLTEDVQLPEPSPENLVAMTNQTITQPRGPIAMPVPQTEPPWPSQSEPDRPQERTRTQRRTGALSEMQAREEAARIGSLEQRAEETEQRVRQIAEGAKRVTSEEYQTEAVQEIEAILTEINRVQALLEDSRLERDMAVELERMEDEALAELKVWRDAAKIPPEGEVTEEARRTARREKKEEVRLRTEAASRRKAAQARQLEGRLTWRQIDEDAFNELLRKRQIETQRDADEEAEEKGWDFGVKAGRTMVVRDPSGRRVVGKVSKDGDTFRITDDKGLGRGGQYERSRRAPEFTKEEKKARKESAEQREKERVEKQIKPLGTVRAELPTRGFLVPSERVQKAREAWNKYARGEGPRPKTPKVDPAPSQSFTRKLLKKYVDQEMTTMQARADKLSRQLGLQNKVVVLDSRQAMIKAPSEWRSAMLDGRLHGFTLPADPQTNTVEMWINPSYDAETQAEIFAHEMGHAVFRSLTLGLDERTARSIIKEFTRWARKHQKKSVQDLIRSKKTPKAQMLYLINGLGNTQVEALSDTEQAYFLDFEEWFADEVSQWLGKTEKPKTNIEKFFHAVGQAITRLYRLIRPTYRSVPSYLESLVGGSRARSDAVPTSEIFQAAVLPGLSDSDVKALRRTFGDQWAEGLAAASITHAFPDMHLELLNAEDLKVLGRAVLSPVVQNQLLRLVDDRTLDLSEPDVALEQAYGFWSQGALNMGPQADTLFKRARNRAQDTLGIVRDMDGARRIFEAMARGTTSTESVRQGRSITRRYLPDSVAEHVVSRFEPAWEVVAKPMRALFVTIDSRIRDTGNPALIQVADKLHKIQGGSPGRTTMWQNKPRYRAGFEARVRRIFEGLSEEDAEAMLDYLYGAKPIGEAPARYRSTITRLQKLMQDMLEYQRDAGVRVEARKNYFPWVLDLEEMEQSRAGFYQTVNQGKYKKDRIGVATTWNRRILERALQGVEQAGELPIDVREDAKMYAADDRVTPEFMEYLTKVGRTSILDRLIHESEVAEAVYDHAMVAGGYADIEGDMDVRGTPTMRFINHRVLSFVDPAEIRPWLSDDLGMTLQSYINSAVKHTEYVRQLGQDGEILHRLLSEAWNDYDATPEELQLAQDYVDASMGTYGRHTAERLNKWFGIKLPKPWSPINENLNRAMGGIMFFQNLIYLTLATLTSMADVLGLAVRSGEFRTAFQGMKSWLQSVRQKEGPNRLKDLSEMLGMVEHADIAEALGFRYDGVYLPGKIAEWNHKLFQITGLNAWTRQTRMMGVATAEAFIARHKREPNQHSERYLTELGLRPEDIKLNQAGKLEILTGAQRQRLQAQAEQGNQGARDEMARDDRVRAAITQFTDEAILRPNPSMRTLWGSDPHFQLFQYLKSFMYAFHDRILKRWWHETMSGNYMASVALLSFIPALLVLDMIRDLLQHGGEDPIKYDWGLWEYTINAADRAGLTGIYSQLFDVTKGPEELFSPLFDTMGHMPGALTLEGDDLRALMPGNVIYNDWID